MEEEKKEALQVTSSLIVQSPDEINKQLGEVPDTINTLNRSSSPVDTFKALSTSTPEEVVNALQNKAAIEIATNDEEVKEKMDENAKKIINTHLNTTKNDTEAKNEK